jgi:DNA-binding transcriptional regulator YdaS (Cro superfamily)
MGIESEEMSRRFPIKKTGISDDDVRVACDLYTAAVGSLQEPGKVAAPLLGISESHLSEMKSGARAITLPRLIGQMRRNRAFAVSVIRLLAKEVGRLEVRERATIGKDQLRKQLVLSLERNPAMLRLALADAAATLGVDEAEAAQVWDGPTQEIKIQ